MENNIQEISAPNSEETKESFVMPTEVVGGLDENGFMTSNENKITFETRLNKMSEDWKIRLITFVGKLFDKSEEQYYEAEDTVIDSLKEFKNMLPENLQNLLIETLEKVNPEVSKEVTG